MDIGCKSEEQGGAVLLDSHRLLSSFFASINQEDRAMIQDCRKGMKTREIKSLGNAVLSDAGLREAVEEVSQRESWGPEED